MSEGNESITKFDYLFESKSFQIQIGLFILSIILGYIISAIFYTNDISLNIFLAYIGLNLAYKNHIISSKENN